MGSNFVIIIYYSQDALFDAIVKIKNYSEQDARDIVTKVTFDNPAIERTSQLILLLL